MTYFHTIGLNHFLTVVVVALAAYRLTRVVVEDTISASFRAWLWRHAYEPAGFDTRLEREVSYRRHGRVGWVWEKAFQLATCPHCTGFWLSIGAFAAWLHGPAWVRTGLLALAVSGIQSFISSRPGA